MKTYPDNGVSASQLPSPDNDLTEVAARLGAPSTMRRNGRIVLQTPLNVSSSGWGLSSGAAAVVTSESYSGPGSLKLTPALTSPYQAAVKHSVPFIIDHSIGVEVSFLAAAGLTFFTLEVDANISGYKYVAAIQISIPGQKLRTWNGSVFQDFYPVSVYAAAWHNLKFTFDFSSATFRALYFDHYTLNMSLFSVIKTATVNNDQILVYLIAEDSTARAGNPAYCNNFIFTIDEA